MKIIQLITLKQIRKKTIQIHLLGDNSPKMMVIFYINKNRQKNFYAKNSKKP